MGKLLFFGFGVEFVGVVGRDVVFERLVGVWCLDEFLSLWRCNFVRGYE